MSYGVTLTDVHNMSPGLDRKPTLQRKQAVGKFTEAKVIETLEKLKELADTAWKEFPESVPVQNAFGELVEEVMAKPFAEGRDVQEE